MLSQIKRKVGTNINNSGDHEKQILPFIKEQDDIYDSGTEHLKIHTQVFFIKLFFNQIFSCQKISNLEKKNDNLERLISVLVKQNEKQLKETENLWKEISKNKYLFKYGEFNHFFLIYIIF